MKYLIFIILLGFSSIAFSQQLNTGDDLRKVKAKYLVVMITPNGLFNKGDTYFEWGEKISDKKGNEINYAHLVDLKNTRLTFRGYAHMLNRMDSWGGNIWNI